MEVTYLTTELPYPVSHGGVMATHCVIQAIAAVASVSVVVLTHTRRAKNVIREAQDYYGRTCRSLKSYTFDNLSPRSSRLIKGWHYLSGYPRHGFWSVEADQILAEEIRNSRCDVLWCGSTFEAKYLRTGKKMNCRTVLTTQNVESDLGRQQMNADSGMARFVSSVRWWDLRRLENMGARWADIMTGITSVDVNYLSRLKDPGRVFLLPFGYSVPKNGFSDGTGSEETSAICFIGSMDWPPNKQAARYLVREVMPLVWKAVPEATCFLVGKNPGEEVRTLACNNVTVTGKVPSVHEYYQCASLIVVPIQGVSGIKIKLVEAMAAGKAVVSTSAGAAGLKVEHRKHLMIADQPREFANAIIELLKNREQRQILGEHAQRFVSENLSPKETERQVKQILACLEQL